MTAEQVVDIFPFCFDLVNQFREDKVENETSIVRAVRPIFKIRTDATKENAVDMSFFNWKYRSTEIPVDLIKRT